MSKRDWTKFIIIALLWGSHYLWVKIVLRELHPITMTGLRILIAAAGLLVFILIAHPPFPKKIPWFSFIFLGLFNLAAPFALIAWSEKYISSGMASILNSTSPLFTLLLSWIFLRDEPFSLTRLLGLFIGFSGVIVLVSGKLTTDNDLVMFGAVSVLLAAICYAASAVYAKRIAGRLDSGVLAFGQVVMGTGMALPAAFLFEAPFTLPRLPLTWIALVTMGLLLTCTGTILYFSLLRSVGPTRTIMVSYLFPLVGVLLGILFLGEEPSWRLLGGGALIIGGIIIVNNHFQLFERVQEQV